MDEQKTDEKPFGDGFYGDIEFNNYLGPGNSIEGKVSFVGRTLFSGSSVLGNITSKGNEAEIYVGPNTTIEGDIRGDRVIFSGHIKGTIDSPNLSITKEGVVAGKIATDRGLSIEPGARISAQISMKKKKKAKEE